jgi:S-formylglutathione hydrolase FrmB
MRSAITLLGPALNALEDPVAAVAARMTTAPDDMNASPDDMKPSPDDMKAPPDDMKSPPDDMKSPPDDMKSPPDNMKSPPDDMKSRPDNMKSPPDNMKSSPDDVQAASEQASTAQDRVPVAPARSKSRLSRRTAMSSDTNRSKDRLCLRRPGCIATRRGVSHRRLDERQTRPAMTMRLPSKIPIALVAFIIASAMNAQTPARLVYDTVHSSALEGNKYGDSPNRPLLVYLPPSYASSPTKRYPVVYLLHGFTVNELSWARGSAGFDIGRSTDSLVAAGAVREMIIVMPNERNRLLGSFYTNSSSGGGWDDFTSSELVSFIDAKYRTLATARSRGIAGHSMGGFGTFYLAMRHGGDVYGAAYALSACCTYFRMSTAPAAAAGWGLIEDLTSLDSAKRLPFGASADLALAAAWSPNPNRPPLFVDFPLERRDGSWHEVEPVLAKWDDHFPLRMIPSSIDRLKRLAGLAFDIGTRDELVPPSQLATMDTALTRAGVPHTFETYDGTHTSGVGQRIITKVLPFFSRTLEFGPSPTTGRHQQ